MTKVMLNQNWEVFATVEVELPAGKEMGDILSVFTQYDQTTIVFKDGTEMEVKNGVENADGDWKFPTKETISDEDFNDFIEFDT